MGSGSRFHKTRSVSFTSGKGGVGKSLITSNIALALSQSGRKVLILDGDLGLANVDIFFGVKAKGNLYEVINGQKDIADIITPVAPRIDIISGGTGLSELTRLTAFERRSLAESVLSLEYMYDDLLIDTATGISDNVLYLNAAADLISVVITPDPSSFTDAYSLIKVLHQQHKENRFSIICNQVRDADDGVSLFSRFSDAVTKFLSVGLDYWGAIPQDEYLRKANHQQRLILKQDNANSAAQALKSISRNLMVAQDQIQAHESSSLFWEQVVGVA